ncbi:hypothetical protein EG329_004321 [Mollisiaceae sp. DMI_Dod_QoI]|nr:hypothetical protein EG329_004321 [Helotiales sp. DMI_Dod_QoI]
MLWTFLSLFLLLHTSQGTLNEVSVATECIDSIVSVVSDFTFAGADLDYYVTACTYNLSVYSMWSAAKLYCTPTEIEAGSALYSGYCVEYGAVELVPYSEIEPKLTDAYIESLQVVNFDDIDETAIWNNSILISKALYQTSRRTDHVFSEEYWLHTIYGWGIYGFWGGLLLLGIINRAVTSIFHSRLERNTRDIEKTVASAPTRSPSSGFLALLHASYHYVRANLIIPATFGSHHRQLLWSCSIPTRLESIIVLAYWALNIGLSCASYEIFWPNIYYTPAIQTWRYVADRTGILCYANLPMLWMFSGRNNVFMWATGWSFSTFNTFHRNIARVATIQAIVHSIGWSAIEGNYGYLLEDWKEKYWYMGGMATVAMSLLLVSSSIFLRQRRYEFFLLLHIAFSVLVIVGLFYHTDIFDGDYNGYLWPLVAIWSFDRFLRIVRFVYCNFRVKTSAGIQHTTSVATYNEESDVIRLEVTTPSKSLQLKPNQHYFLYQPLRWRGWENHPFTLASWAPAGTSNIEYADSALANSTFPPAKSELDIEVASPSSQDTPSSHTSDHNSSQNEASHPAAGSYKLVFYARPFSGWTKRLRDSCIKHPNKAINARIMIEGPYGTSEPLHHYENILFITGGTGISGAVSYLQDHIAKSASRSTRTNNISLIFAAKQLAMIRYMAARELGPILGRSDVHATFHVTSPRESAASGSENAVSISSSSDMEVSYGRPDVKAAISSFVGEISDAGSAGGRIAVFVCGPAAMADDARAAVHQVLKSGKREVAYFEETFGW